MVKLFLSSKQDEEEYDENACKFMLKDNESKNEHIRKKVVQLN